MKEVSQQPFWERGVAYAHL